MKRATLWIGIAALLASLTACNDQPATPRADYFPTPPKGSWRYVNTYAFHRDSASFGSDTSAYAIEKDTIVDGKQYAVLTLTLHWGYRYQWGIRKANGNYYSLVLGTSGPGKERLFLKDNLPAGGSWEESSEDGHSKRVYTITARPAEKRIGEKVYRDVIEVEEEVWTKEADGQFAPRWVVEHCYARNVGRIYAYYPYPSFLTYSDQELELLEYNPR
ncbi:MAG: hypothetical protein ICV83_00885 [Cytophagales bacterium]|nr:hypothetical protein [Cytophagales bacterium]